MTELVGGWIDRRLGWRRRRLACRRKLENRCKAPFDASEAALSDWCFLRPAGRLIFVAHCVRWSSQLRIRFAPRKTGRFQIKLQPQGNAGYMFTPSPGIIPWIELLASVPVLLIRSSNRVFFIWFDSPGFLLSLFPAHRWLISLVSTTVWQYGTRFNNNKKWQGYKGIPFRLTTLPVSKKIWKKVWTLTHHKYTLSQKLNPKFRTQHQKRK